MGDIRKKRLLSKLYELRRLLIWFAAKWARQDSNLRPTGYEPAALPLSYEPTLPPMKSFTFHGNQFCVERETGLEPATPYLEGGAVPEPHFLPFLNLKSGRKPPLFRNIQMTAFFDLPPLA